MTRSSPPSRCLFPARQTVKKTVATNSAKLKSPQNFMTKSGATKKQKKKKAKKIEIKYEIKSNQIKVYVANIGEP